MGHTRYPGLQAPQVAETKPTPELLPASPSQLSAGHRVDGKHALGWCAVALRRQRCTGEFGGGLLLLLLVPHLRPLVSPQGRLKT